MNAKSHITRLTVIKRFSESLELDNACMLTKSYSSRIHDILRFRFSVLRSFSFMPSQNKHGTGVYECWLSAKRYSSMNAKDHIVNGQINLFLVEQCAVADEIVYCMNGTHLRELSMRFRNIDSCIRKISIVNLSLGRRQFWHALLNDCWTAIRDPKCTIWKKYKYAVIHW